jgi:hypothetical protein
VTELIPRKAEILLHEAEGIKKLPPIVPILIHHSDTGWTAPTAFQDIEPEAPSFATLLFHLICFERRRHISCGERVT